MRGDGRQVLGVVIHVVAVDALAGAAMTVAMVGDNAKAVVEEE